MGVVHLLRKDVLINARGIVSFGILLGGRLYRNRTSESIRISDFGVFYVISILRGTNKSLRKDHNVLALSYRKFMPASSSRVNLGFQISQLSTNARNIGLLSSASVIHTYKAILTLSSSFSSFRDLSSQNFSNYALCPLWFPPIPFLLHVSV
jgi:hypothetical protein